jgi:hypothetical protein
VVTDPGARLPEFLQIMHRLVAAAMNTHLGRVENLWAAEASSVVQLDHPDDVLDKLAYSIVNPVAAGLVKDPRDWPGVITTRFGETLVAERPAVFFRESGHMPERIRLVCTLPPVLHHLGLDGAAKRLRMLVQESLRRAKSLVRSQGRGFLDADGVRTMPIDRAHPKATTFVCLARSQPAPRRAPTGAHLPHRISRCLRLLARRAAGGAVPRGHIPTSRRPRGQLRASAALVGSPELRAGRTQSVDARVCRTAASALTAGGLLARRRASSSAQLCGRY